MSRYLSTSHFYIFIFVVVVLCSTLFVSGNASNAAVETDEEGKLSVDLFAVKTAIKNVKEPTGDSADTTLTKTITLCQIRSHFFLFAAKGGEVVALTEAEYTEEGSPNEKKVDVVAKFIEADNANLKNKNIKDTAGSWTTQLVTKDNQRKKFSLSGTFAVNADGEKIYILLVNIADGRGNGKLKFKLLKGTVSSEVNSNKIEWETEEIKTLKDGEAFENKLEVDKIKSFVDDGSAFLIKDKKFLFVVKGESTDASKKVAAVFQFEESKKEELTLVHHESHEKFYPTFFKWGEEIFMIPTDDSGKSKGKLMMFNAAEEPKFIVTDNSINRLHSFLKDKKSFLTATIENKGAVLLFTQQKKVDSNIDKENVYLWMTDGTRVSCAGTIVENLSSTDTLYASLLYTGNKLFALHQTVKTTEASQNNNNIEFTLLKKQLQNITKTLDAWKKCNEDVENFYKDAARATGINFTDRIVGFLFGDRESTNDWKDQCLYVNAEITKPGRNAEKVPHGYRFSGAGLGAQWPVVKQEDQRYNFINSGFSLVATVTVGSDTKVADNSVFGIGLTNNNYVGLWCTKGKWVVKDKNNQINIPSSDINCTNGEKYYVALILRENKKIFFYVDGEQLPKLDSEGILIEQLQNVEYFYFGVDKNKQSENADVTIENVLLYNRPFEKDKIDKLKQEKNMVDGSQTIEDTTTSQKTSNTSNTAVPQDTETTKNGEEPQPSSSPPPTTEDSAVRVGVVGVLCFMLFCVFTLLGRYVY